MATKRRASLSRKTVSATSVAPTIRKPTFQALTRAEMDAVLARNHVGRLAYYAHRVDIEPIHYVYGEGVIYARTSPGAKLTALQHDQWVAFEVDEIEGLFDWRSVVIQGSVYPVDDGAAKSDHVTYERTLERLRELVPETLLAGDPAPLRGQLFRIHIQTISGRKAEQFSRAQR